MTTQQLLDERYGRATSRRTRAWAWSVLGVVVLAAAAWFAWVTIARYATAATGTATAYRVVDARTVSVTFQVAAPAGAKPVCVLEADDQDHGIVGWKVVHLPAVGAGGATFTQAIPTVAAATTGLVNSCWVP